MKVLVDGIPKIQAFWTRKIEHVGHLKKIIFDKRSVGKWKKKPYELNNKEIFKFDSKFRGNFKKTPHTHIPLTHLPTNLINSEDLSLFFKIKNLITVESNLWWSGSPPSETWVRFLHEIHVILILEYQAPRKCKSHSSE